jgi:hypothetical protein
VLYGRNDTILWHPPAATAGRGEPPYYETARPTRCVRGLADLRA